LDCASRLRARSAGGHVLGVPDPFRRNQGAACALCLCTRDGWQPSCTAADGEYRRLRLEGRPQGRPRSSRVPARYRHLCRNICARNAESQRPNPCQHAEHCAAAGPVISAVNSERFPDSSFGRKSVRWPVSRGCYFDRRRISLEGERRRQHGSRGCARFFRAGLGLAAFRRAGGHSDAAVS
jgi:hypothetical protein